MTMESSPKQDKSFLLSLLGQPNTTSNPKTSDATRSSTDSPALSKSSITRSFHDDHSLREAAKPQPTAAKIFGMTNDREESPSTTGSSKPSTPPPAENEHQDLLWKLLSNLPTNTPSQVVPEVPDSQAKKNTKTAQKRKKKQKKKNKDDKSNQSETQPVQKKRRTSDLDFDALLAIHEDKPQQKGVHEHGKPSSVAGSKLGNMSNAAPADILSIANQGRDPTHEKAKRAIYKQAPKPNLKSKHQPRKVPLPPMDQRPECRFFKVGKCKEGERCRFRHVGESMRLVCRHFKTGSCNKGYECNFLHDLSIEPCRFYHLNSKCEAGDSCPYSHKPLTQEARKRLRLLTGPCKFYHLKGVCTNGDECMFSHDYMSQYELDELKASATPEEAPKPCAMYHIHGRCSNGDRCSFSHAPISDEERRELVEMFSCSSTK